MAKFTITGSGPDGQKVKHEVEVAPGAHVCEIRVTERPFPALMLKVSVDGANEVVGDATRSMNSVYMFEPTEVFNLGVSDG